MRHAASMWLVAGLVSLALLGSSVQRWLTARSHRAGEHARLDRAIVLAADIAAARAATPSPEAVSTPTLASELPARLAATLSSCGLPASAISSFATQAARGTAAAGPTTHRGTLVLGSLTLSQVGRFLAAWRVMEPDWVFTSIELTPGGRAASPAAELPVHCVLVMEAVLPGGGDGDRE